MHCFCSASARLFGRLSTRYPHTRQTTVYICMTAITHTLKWTCMAAYILSNGAGCAFVLWRNDVWFFSSSALCLSPLPKWGILHESASSDFPLLLQGGVRRTRLFTTWDKWPVVYKWPKLISFLIEVFTKFKTIQDSCVSSSPGAWDGPLTVDKLWLSTLIHKRGYRKECLIQGTNLFLPSLEKCMPSALTSDAAN